MTKLIKIFIDPIKDREKYLNKMSSRGFRLIDSGSVIQRFTKTERKDIHYSVQYIGNLNNKQRIDYIDFIKNLNLKIYYSPLNIGKLAIGNFRYRPYNNRIATSPGMINKEILIVEYYGNKNIPIYSDKKSASENLMNIQRKNTYLGIISLMVLILGITKKQGNIIEKTIISFRPLEKYPEVWIITGLIILVISIINLYRTHRVLKSMED